MIKAVFFDVDHTLVSHKLNGIPQSTLQAIQMLQKQGILVFIATGRHRIELANMDLQDIVWDGYITLNGQLCYNKEFEVMDASPLHPHDRSILEDAFFKKEIPIFFVEENALYTNMHTSELQKAQDLVSSPMPNIGEPGNEPVYQVTLFADEDYVKRIVSTLSYSKFTGWKAFGSDIIGKQGGKAQGIEKILAYYNINQEETLAFGDGENDMDMLAFCHIGVAMGNAHEELKNIADFVTDDIESDGILKALRYLNIL